MHYWFALALAALLAAPAQADVYKCRDADGKLSFTDRPCPKGAQSETVEIVDPASDAAVASIEPGCVDLAQAVWRLQPMEAGGRLSADQRSELSGARNDGSRSTLPSPKSWTVVPNRCSYRALAASTFTDA